MFALFAGDDYYPSGGWEDFRGTGTIEELKAKYERLGKEWGQIVDLEQLRIVARTWEGLGHWSPQ